MNAQESAALARKVIDAYNAHELDRLEDYFAPNSETVTVATGERSLGADGARRDTERWLNAFPDMSFEILELVGADDVAVAELRFEGTHTGTLSMPEGDLAPTGRVLRQMVCMVMRFENGKVISEHDYFDRTSMTEQLGVGQGRPASTSEEIHPVP